jgi:UDPglucose 6-dehydrogenase
MIRSETDHPFDVVSNPEFLKEGAAVNDFMNPDRVVIGTSDPRVAELMMELYSPYLRTGNPVIVMDVTSAEMTKYAANAMLAVRISFMNEVANLCDRLGADVDMVRRGVGSDRRIGPAFLFAGIGYGGSCFPKDVQAISHTAREAGYEFQIVEATHRVNVAQKLVLVEKIHSRFGADLSGLRFAIWGLSFKPRTDDMRDAPSLIIIEQLLKAGAILSAYDPAAGDEARHILGGRAELNENRYDVLDGVDALLICTEWNEFREPDFTQLLEKMRTPVIFDGRNLFDPSLMKKRGFEYYSIGRPMRV